MSILNIDEKALPDLTGKVAVVSGGSSGIGWATALLLASRNAQVFVLDIQQPTNHERGDITWLHCDVSDWASIQEALAKIPRIDICIANAATLGDESAWSENTETEGVLNEPHYSALDVNVRGTLNLIKSVRYHMLKRGVRGSIVVTASAAGYFPEPLGSIYSATKAFILSFVRTTHMTMIQDGITLNAVAPFAVRTPMVPAVLLDAIEQAGVPVATPHNVAIALAHSATAVEDQSVYTWGKARFDADLAARVNPEKRWNGRSIVVLGNKYKEVEEQQAKCHDHWLGVDFAELSRKQQAMTDPRS